MKCGWLRTLHTSSYHHTGKNEEIEIKGSQTVKPGLREGPPSKRLVDKYEIVVEVLQPSFTNTVCGMNIALNTAVFN